ncbi:hypothetical protein SeGA_5919 [Salmonella enterica subsp. enterica serovar Gaminara str. A4-567]|nr:hypothetical protein SeGA_5919 [Salmonella enterica subsp. enterica serovar Gaminara str. A4-567]
MMQFFQRLLGKTSAPAPIRGPLGLHLNAGFTLDTLAFRLLESSLLVALPGEKYTVAAASRIDLGGGSQIFRYYTSGDEFLQINTTGGTDVDDIDDIKLFVYEESFGINEERHWRSAIAPAAIGPMTLNWQERRWQRFQLARTALAAAGSAFLTMKSRAILNLSTCWKRLKISRQRNGTFTILRWASSAR